MEQILNNIFFMCLVAYVVTLIYDYLTLKLAVKLTDEPIGKFEVVCMLVPGVNVLLGCWWTFMLIVLSFIELIMLFEKVLIKSLTDDINGIQ